MGYPKFLGWENTSRERVEGSWLPEKHVLEPKIWHVEWPKKLQARLVTPKKPVGDLDKNDLEISVKILEWLVLKGIVRTKNLRYKHIGLFRDNMAAVSSAQREVERDSASSGRIIRVLALRQQVARASPLVVALVKGDLNVLGGIPSRSFANNSEFFIPHKFPIPTFSSAFLARLLTFLRVEYESDFQVGDKGISNGRLEATSVNREKF